MIRIHSGMIFLGRREFNRGLFILTLVFIPLAVVLCFSDSFLTKLGQDPEVSKHAQKYIIVTLPCMFLRCFFDLMRKFLNCMTASWVPMTAQLVSTVIHPIFCYCFVVVYDFDIVGIGMACNLTMLILVLKVLFTALTAE